jgi:hypothetical protein
VSSKRLVPILTAVAIATAAVDGLRTYLIEVVGFLTGICLGALGWKRSKEPTPMTKEEALAALRERQANRPEQIDNFTSSAGSPQYFYCVICGALADIRFPVYNPYYASPLRLPVADSRVLSPLVIRCAACHEMENAGWLE